VTALIQEANRRVYERASADEQATGMGTTMTAALVEDERVVIGHVGDSRAYLVRDGKLEQLTQDHSLVAELVRSGKLSPEEADSHPQRSVITRALGPEPDVDIDMFSISTQPGDLFLLCSDGLSSMVGDDEIVRVLSENRDDLEEAAAALVQAANQAGGEDNITVICFEIVAAGEAPPPEPAPAPVDEQEEEEEDTLDELADVPAASITTIRQAPVLPKELAEREAAEREPRAEPTAPARRRRKTWVYVGLVVVLLALAVVAGLWGISRAHFVGADGKGRVTVYQGLPWDIVGGVRLYRAVYVSPLLAQQLTQDERKRLFDHDLESKDSALVSVKQLEQKIGLR
jgi:protein phosphatase